MQRIDKVLVDLFDNASQYFNCDDIQKLLTKQTQFPTHYKI